MSQDQTLIADKTMTTWTKSVKLAGILFYFAPGHDYKTFRYLGNDVFAAKTCHCGKNWIFEVCKINLC